MTALPEAKLAREAELPYALLALATDYDCWHESEEDVSVEAVLAVMKKNVVIARRAVAELARALPDPTASPASKALAGALMTARDRMEPAALARLDWLVGKYVH
jgi:5'-methylthioadenosine phosphorylase